MKRLNLCLQICPVDKFAGLKLAELICDIEPVMRDDVEFTLSTRRDTNKFTADEIMGVLREKFATVHRIKGKRFGTGWPNGCNDLWAETMMRVQRKMRDGDITSTGTLTFESDCIPLRPDWINVLCDEWDKRGNKLVVGHEHRFGDEKTPPNHINGNAIFDNNILTQYDELHGSSATAGWDAFHGKLLLSIGKDTPFIFQKYRMKSITKQEVLALRKHGQIPALFHGIKGDDGINAIREMTLDGSFQSRIK